MILRRTNSRGFTVTELLVVVAIIALLLALVLVGFQKAKLMARTMSCLSNQRQISLAQSSYATDNGGAFASPCTSFRGAMGAFTLTSDTCGNFPIVLNNGNLTNVSYHSWTASYPGADREGNERMNGGAENEGALKQGASHLFPRHQHRRPVFLYGLAQVAASYPYAVEDKVAIA